MLSASEVDALKRLVVVGFLLRAALGLVLHWTGYSRMLAPDEQTYMEDGWAIAQYWSGDTVSKPWRYLSGQPVGYFQLNAFFFVLFGPTEVPIKIINALVGAITVRYVYLIARELSDAAAARRAAILACVLPSLVLWAAVNIRDVWVIFLLVFASWQGLQLQNWGSRRPVVWYAITVFLLSRLRDYLVYIALVPPIVALLIGHRGRLGRNFLLASAIALGGLFMLEQGIVGERTQSRLSLEGIAQLRQDMATGGSAFERGADISTPGRAVLFLPIGLAYFLFSPFPWQITSVLKVIALPEMLLLYYLVPSVVRGLRWVVRERFRASLQMLLLTALITVSYALGSGNVGTMYRHRAQAIVFVLILAAIGRELRMRAVRPVGLSPPPGVVPGLSR